MSKKKKQVVGSAAGRKCTQNEAPPQVGGAQIRRIGKICLLVVERAYLRDGACSGVQLSGLGCCILTKIGAGHKVRQCYYYKVKMDHNSGVCSVAL